jgi:Tol biopolymer transport system component
VRFDRNGANRLLLTGEEHNNSHPYGCGDGRHIVFESYRSGDHVWKMDADGSNPTRLTNGKGESFPVCSPDGRWVAYLDASNALQLWRMSIEGLNPHKLSEEIAFPIFRISADGERIAGLSIESQPAPHWLVIVIDANSGEKLSSMDLALDAADFAWAPDARALDFITTRNSVSNVFRQSLSGEAAKQVTNFTSGNIFTSAWSLDGKQLALARGQTESDVVLITNLK